MPSLNQAGVEPERCIGGGKAAVPSALDAGPRGEAGCVLVNTQMLRHAAQRQGCKPMRPIQRIVPVESSWRRIVDWLQRQTMREGSLLPSCVLHGRDARA